MASPFQQQARQRKILYVVLILVLFTLSWIWRSTVVADQARELAIREESRGDVDLVGAVVREGLTGSRGLAICVLWNEALDAQKKNQWNDLEVLVSALTKLQPHFITPWLFQSWNLSYNVSVESDRVRDKYFYIARGIELLAQGERQNKYHPDLRWSIGFYMQHKICQSDETNYQRSLFQLSLIPPNERDPARFYQRGTGDSGPVFNYEEFKKFTEQHPQLVRRLREGIHQQSLREKKRLFTCETPEAVVQFLEDNFQVPSLYQVPPTVEGVPASLRPWDPNKTDKLLTGTDRFPSLPPPHEKAFDPKALVLEDDPNKADTASLRDSTDAHEVSHSWYCYSQEPIPDADKLPGSTQPLTDRVRQRRPRNMTTLIFRNYPAQACRYMAERLQEEGWYDKEPWDVSEWFEPIGARVEVGGGVEWSEEAWKRAFRAWDEHGRKNHLLFVDSADEENKQKLAERFAGHYRIKVGGPVPRLRDEEMTGEEKAEYEAAKFLFEYGFYRNVSNFAHHHNRAFVEQKPETVACRKLFFKAEQLNLAGSPKDALELYRTPVTSPAWPGAARSPLTAWRDLVLLGNKAFRDDSFTQEQTAEYQIRYMLLYNRRQGKELKEDIGRMAKLLPLVPKFSNDTFRPPIFQGPFDWKVKEEKKEDGSLQVTLLPMDALEGTPLINSLTMQVTVERMHLPTIHQRPGPPPGRMPPGGGRLTTPKVKNPSPQPPPRSGEGSKRRTPPPSPL